MPTLQENEGLSGGAIERAAAIGCGHLCHSGHVVGRVTLCPPAARCRKTEFSSAGDGDGRTIPPWYACDAVVYSYVALDTRAPPAPAARPGACGQSAG